MVVSAVMDGANIHTPADFSPRPSVTYTFGSAPLCSLVQAPLWVGGGRSMRTVGPSVGRSSVRRSVGQSVGQSVGRSVGRLVGRLVMVAAAAAAVSVPSRVAGTLAPAPMACRLCEVERPAPFRAPRTVPTKKL